MSEETCTRKVAYASQQDAEKGMTRMSHLDCGDDTLNAYQCSVCANWHIGHAPMTSLDRLPRLAGFEFIGVRKDNGNLVHCTSMVNSNGLIITMPVSRNELKGWIEEKWFAQD